MASYELRVEPQADAIPELIKWAEACCAENGLADDIRLKVALVLEEAALNVVTHGFIGREPPHSLTIRLDLTPQLAVAELADNGRPFDPTAVPDPDLLQPLGERQSGGLGILLIRRLMDRVQYCRDGDRNVLRLEKTRP